MIRVPRRVLAIAFAILLVPMPVPSDVAAAADLSAMDGGNNYACATDAVGSVSCWGLNAHGQADPPAGHFKDISAGSYHTCGVGLDASITCWGSAIIEALTPPAGTFKEVSAGDYHTCAIRTDDTIVCWVNQPDTQPILNEPLGQFHGLASGSAAACALDSADHITCWGHPAVAGPPSGAFDSVVVGADFGCALRSTGTVDCWGAQPDPVGGGYVEIAGGGTAWCGLKTDGSMDCPANPHEWGPFSLDGPYDMIAVDWRHVCGRRVGGSIECDSYASPDPGIDPYVISGAPPTGAVGQPYQHQVFTTEMHPLPTWSITAGSLPPGVSLDADGSISGVPTTAGLYQVSIRGSNGIAPIIDHDLSVDVAVGDTIPPTATAPTWRLVNGSSISAGRTTVRLGWTGSDATSGIDRYELAQSTDGGAWASVSTSLTGTSLDRALGHGHTYRFRVRAVDTAGNVGAWMTGPTFRLTHYGEASASVKYSGTWSTSTSSVYWGGKAKASSQAGAKASLTFTGRSIEVVSRKGPARGKAQIYINGVLKATVDLYAASYQNQRVVWTGSWSSAATRTITVRVVGTSGRPRVDLDAFVVGS